MNKQLEFPFLQIVAKYLTNRKNVFDFIKINKKCKNSILLLKTNSFFIYPNELDLFPNIETLNIWDDVYSSSIYLKDDDESIINKWMDISNLKFNLSKIQNIYKYTYDEIIKYEKNKDIKPIFKQIIYEYTFKYIERIEILDLSNDEYINLYSLSIDLPIYRHHSYYPHCDKLNLIGELSNLKILIIKSYSYGYDNNYNDEYIDKLIINISLNNLEYFKASMWDNNVIINLNTPNLKILVNSNSKINVVKHNLIGLMYYKCENKNCYDLNIVNENGNKNENKYEIINLNNENYNDEIFYKYYNDLLYDY